MQYKLACLLQTNDVYRNEQCDIIEQHVNCIPILRLIGNLFNYVYTCIFIIYFKILPVGSIALNTYFNISMLWSAKNNYGFGGI